MLKFETELREIDGDEFYVAVDIENGLELAPIFEAEETCDEIARRCTMPSPDSDYMNGIPLVPYQTPVPRPAGLADHPAHVARRLAQGEPAFVRGGEGAQGRHPLNPAS